MTSGRRGRAAHPAAWRSAATAPAGAAAGAGRGGSPSSAARCARSVSISIRGNSIAGPSSNRLRIRRAMREVLTISSALASASGARFRERSRSPSTSARGKIDTAGHGKDARFGGWFKHHLRLSGPRPVLIPSGWPTSHQRPGYSSANSRPAAAIRFHRTLSENACSSTSCSPSVFRICTPP